MRSRMTDGARDDDRLRVKICKWDDREQKGVRRNVRMYSSEEGTYWWWP